MPAEFYLSAARHSYTVGQQVIIFYKLLQLWISKKQSALSRQESAVESARNLG